MVNFCKKRLSTYYATYGWKALNEYFPNIYGVMGEKPVTF